MHLLIIDDEPVIRMGLMKMAEQYSPSFTHIESAENGEAALEKIRASEPDIILTDIRMPKMDGLELCRILHEEFPRIKTVVISGYGDFEYAQKCMGYGVKQYLLKPATMQDVYDIFNQFIKHPARGYVSPSRYIEWIDRMEHHIWSLQANELKFLNEQWRQHLLSSEMSLPQLIELLSNCHAMLLKRFQTRDFTPQWDQPYMKASNRKEALDAFETELHLMIAGLNKLRNGNFKDPMDEAKAFIDSKLSQEISLEQVAAMIGLTPTYFSSLFKKLTNETFVQYRINRRMEKAKELLTVPHIRIVDVAVEVGYEDYPHFTKTFKKIVGTSPSDYRNGLGIVT